MTVSWSCSRFESHAAYQQSTPNMTNLNLTIDTDNVSSSCTNFTWVRSLVFVVHRHGSPSLRSSQKQQSDTDLDRGHLQGL
jgi:hypothetical protein